MTNAEQAIRNALLKIDARNKATRRRVYESAWNAHERALLADETLNDVKRSERRNRLMRLIRLIEDEYQLTPPASQNDSQDDLTVTNDTLYSNGPEEQIDIEVDGASNQDYKRLRGHGLQKRPTHRLTILAVIIGCAILSVFIIWSFFNSLSGRTIIENQSDGAMHSSAPIELPERPQNQNAKDDGWIRFFHPGDATSVTTRGGASVDIRVDAGESYLRIFANSANDAAIIDIGEGALNTLRGKKVLLDIDAKSDSGQTSQLSITCDLGQGSDCGRRRFEVPSNREDILFQIDIPANSSGPAKLYLTSDLLGEGHAIDIFGMRMRAAE
ncbi:hypothetical protein [Bartonella sp. LJL80]